MEVTSGTAVDGFIWRKYGQKDINGHKHPRQVDSFTRGSGRELSCRSIWLTGGPVRACWSDEIPPCRLYYRCAHKDQGCNATRRVQQTREQPAAYEIAYYGEHTCRGAWQQGGAAAAAVAPPAVVDFGSSSWGSAADTSRSSPSQGGWSSPSASSEVGVGFGAQLAHEWHDTAAPDPVTEFLDGCFGWESVLQDRFDFGGLSDVATFQQ
jgi:hypothetical protein